MLTAEFSHLRGESLTEAEEKWKWRKTLLNSQGEKRFLVLSYRDHMWRDEVSFEQMVENVERKFEPGFIGQLSKKLWKS